MEKASVNKFKKHFYNIANIKNVTHTQKWIVIPSVTADVNQSSWKSNLIWNSSLIGISGSCMEIKTRSLMALERSWNKFRKQEARRPLEQQN